MTILSNACDEIGFALPRLEDKLSTDALPEQRPLMCTGGDRSLRCDVGSNSSAVDASDSTLAESSGTDFFD